MVYQCFLDAHELLHEMANKCGGEDRVLTKQSGHHYRFNPHNGRVDHGRCGRQSGSMAVEDLIAKEISRSNQPDDCLLALRRRCRQLYSSRLQEKNVGCLLSLAENNLPVVVLDNLIACLCR